MLFQHQANVEALRRALLQTGQKSHNEVSDKKASNEDANVNKQLTCTIGKLQEMFQKNGLKESDAVNFEKKVAKMLMQSEQQSIAELNSRMNKHIDALTCLLNKFPNANV